MQIWDFMESFFLSLDLRPFRFKRICRLAENWYIPVLGAVKRPFRMLKAFPLWNDPAAKGWKIRKTLNKQHELIQEKCMSAENYSTINAHLMKRMEFYECFAIH